jgi:hypothetical protein
MLVLMMRGMYEVGHWDRHRWHDIHTRFHKDLFRHSTVRGDTYTQKDDLIRRLLFFPNNESRIISGYIFWDPKIAYWDWLARWDIHNSPLKKKLKKKIINQSSQVDSLEKWLHLNFEKYTAKGSFMFISEGNKLHASRQFESISWRAKGDK